MAKSEAHCANASSTSPSLRTSEAAAVARHRDARVVAPLLGEEFGRAGHPPLLLGEASSDPASSRSDPLDPASSQLIVALPIFSS